jgi:hypothetical protein
MRHFFVVWGANLKGRKGKEKEKGRKREGKEKEGRAHNILLHFHAALVF